MCFPQSPNAVTFRAHMTGSPQVPAQQLATFLEDWTSSGAFLTVQAQQLTADSNCTIIIASQSEEECNSDKVVATVTPKPVPTLLIAVVSSVPAFVVLVLCVVVVAVTLVKRKRKRTVRLQALSVPPMQQLSLHTHCC